VDIDADGHFDDQEWNALQFLESGVYQDCGLGELVDPPPSQLGVQTRPRKGCRAGLMISDAHYHRAATTVGEAKNGVSHVAEGVRNPSQRPA
jgi:hypothetical protein